MAPGHDKPEAPARECSCAGTSGLCHSQGGEDTGNRSTEQKAGLPADALGGRAQLLQGPVLDLPHALLADPQQVPDLAQAVGAVAGQAEAQVEHLALARPQALHEELKGLLTLGVLTQRLR